MACLPKKKKKQAPGRSGDAYGKKSQSSKDRPCSHTQSRFLGRGCDEALFSEKKGIFSEKGGGNSVNQGFGKDLYRKGNSVKRFGPFTEPPDSEN